MSAVTGILWEPITCLSSVMDTISMVSPHLRQMSTTVRPSISSKPSARKIAILLMVLPHFPFRFLPRLQVTFSDFAQL